MQAHHGEKYKNLWKDIEDLTKRVERLNIITMSINGPNRAIDGYNARPMKMSKDISQNLTR